MISQFFEPISSSPNKKRKLQDEAEAEVSIAQADVDDTTGEHDEAMPGFYEHDEEDGEIGMDVVDDDIDGTDPSEPIAGPSSLRPRPPVSAPAPSSQDKNPLDSNLHKKPRSTGSTRPPPPPPPPTIASSSHLSLEPNKDGDEMRIMLECPICGKGLDTDNQGLNSHVDFCLSRGAILEAQSKAKSPVKPFKGWEKKGEGRRKKG